MNSFRGKLGLRLTTDANGANHHQTTSSSKSDFHVEVSIDGSLSEDSSIDSLPYFDFLKKRADTADTEASFHLTASKDSIRDDNDSILEAIATYDEDECMIWYADCSYSLSNDEDDTVTTRNNTLLKQQATLTPLDTKSLFAEADNMLACHEKPAGYSIVLPEKRGKKSRNNVFSNNSHNKTAKGKGFLARSRKFFSLSNVPASIAEEPCSTPSSTSASAPLSPY